ncbi:hypothetical protein CEE62_04630 [Stenotrophomonas maltophilia]|nr:hypothetical protein [Stenotrophomonas maltophilia]OWQ82063.1 hypothetical protein CEE62_04630 [Stenotrophomonas maltophilia]
MESGDAENDEGGLQSSDLVSSEDERRKRRNWLTVELDTVMATVERAMAAKEMAIRLVSGASQMISVS